VSVSKLLFLVHRIPFPPNKGDKIRSYNFLAYLAKEYEIYLGAFIDSAADRRYRSELDRYCREACLVDLHPVKKRLLSTLALLAGEPLSVRYFWDRQLSEWVKRVMCENKIENVLVFSSPMAKYIDELRGHFRYIVDFVDVDSQKWAQYGNEHRWPMSWIYTREGEKLLAYERNVASRSDCSVFVSRSEAELFQKLAPEVSDRISYVENGVDTEYFRPSPSLATPYGEADKVLVFTGAMDYWANVDSVIWFTREVLPAIREAIRGVKFYIVGSNPVSAVTDLAQVDGVHVTGTVLDIRPYLQYANAAVAPLRIARGVQNKVLEAMAMAVPVIASPQALEGIENVGSADVYEGGSVESMKQAAIDVLSRPRTVSEASRAFITQGYDWNRNSAKLDQLLRGEYATA